jgi:hypothetical protein
MLRPFVALFNGVPVTFAALGPFFSAGLSEASIFFVGFESGAPLVNDLGVFASLTSFGTRPSNVAARAFDFFVLMGAASSVAVVQMSAEHLL